MMRAFDEALRIYDAKGDRMAAQPLRAVTLQIAGTLADRRIYRLAVIAHDAHVEVGRTASETAILAKLLPRTYAFLLHLGFGLHD